MPVTGSPQAVVTGAGRGIGAAVALALARAGWDLVLGDVPTPDTVSGLSYPLSSAAELAQTAAACRSAGVRVSTAACDVRQPEQVRTLCALADDRLRAAVAVAGILGADGPAWQQGPEDLDRDLSVNLHGIANLARCAVPMMLAGPKPVDCRFVAVVSSAADHGLPRLASYVASKHAALGYIRSLAADLAEYGITANAVLPGSTRTRLLTRTADVYGLTSVDGFVANQRMNRLLEPAEIAATVEFLVSPQASAVTGAGWSVDGGFTG